jgi:short-subunit dehydrogenase
MNLLITGSSSGLGHSLAMTFAKTGHRVILHGRDEQRIAEMRLAIGRLGGECEAVLGDLRDEKTLADLFAAALHWEIDILINNAGVYYDQPISETTPHILEATIRTNLIIPIRLALLVYPIFCAKGSGLIVNINSLAGKGFNSAEAVYCASKWGLRGFMGSFRYEARKHGVGVLDVYLGAMRTMMTEGRDGTKIDTDEAAVVIYKACTAYSSLHVNEIEIGRRT